VHLSLQGKLRTPQGKALTLNTSSSRRFTPEEAVLLHFADNNAENGNGVIVVVCLQEETKYRAKWYLVLRTALFERNPGRKQLVPLKGR
jgi:hypothetical protein